MVQTMTKKVRFRFRFFRGPSPLCYKEPFPGRQTGKVCQHPGKVPGKGLLAPRGTRNLSALLHSTGWRITSRKLLQAFKKCKNAATRIRSCWHLQNQVFISQRVFEGHVHQVLYCRQNKKGMSRIFENKEDKCTTFAKHGSAISRSTRN